MKKLFLLFLLFLVVGLNAYSQQNDTIKIQTHKDVIIQTDPSKGSTNYPAWGVFPSKETPIRRIIGYLTFECPPNLNCGEWDYLNWIYIGRKGGVDGENINWELGRFITPYGNSWKKGNPWKHGWYYDFTDFAGLLNDSIEIIYKHTGYEAKDDRGWKINLTFYCIKGTPIRTPIKISNSGYTDFTYNNAAKPLDSLLPEKSIKLDPATKSVRMVLTQTGHGMDKPENCSEFCDKFRIIKFDGKQINKRQIWRECGFSPVFPQAGTWLYDRANWCPGSSVMPDNVDVFGLTGGTDHTYDVDMQSYNSNDGAANYSFKMFLVQYGEMNAKYDIAMEQIIAPSKEYENNRYNPICGNPIVVIKNNGSEIIKECDIIFGMKGQQKTTYKWKGNLKFGMLDTVKIPLQFATSTNEKIFEVELKLSDSLQITKNKNNIQAGGDQYPADNFLTSEVDFAPTLPNKIVVLLKTNNAASENYYYIKDGVTGEVLFEKNDLENNKTYRDTLDLPAAKCYNFEFYDDGPPPGNYPLNKDGLSWWANSNDGSGYVRILSMENKVIKNFQADFGAKFYYQFMATDIKSINDFPEEKVSFMYVYPNPNSGKFTVDYLIADSNYGNLEVYDLTGKKVYEQKLETKLGNIDIDLANISKGNYIVKILSSKGTELLTRKFQVQ